MREIGLDTSTHTQTLLDYQENPIKVVGTRRIPMLLGDSRNSVAMAPVFTVTAGGADNALCLGKLICDG